MTKLTIPLAGPKPKPEPKPKRAKPSPGPASTPLTPEQELALKAKIERDRREQDEANNAEPEDRSPGWAGKILAAAGVVLTGRKGGAAPLTDAERRQRDELERQRNLDGLKNRKASEAGGPDNPSGP